MPETLDIVCSAHHASADFGEFSERCALNETQRMRFSDYGTADTVPRDGLHAPLIATHSRGVVDLNRAPDSNLRFPDYDFGRPTKNAIWLPGKELDFLEREAVVRDIYRAYHARLLDVIDTFTRPGLVVAWDNTAPYEISNEKTGEKEMMPTIILSNLGTRDSSGMSDVQELYNRGERTYHTSCDPRLLEELQIELSQNLRAAGFPDDVFLNRVYKGGYIAEFYNNRRHAYKHFPVDVQSLQIEYNTALTHDVDSLKPDHGAIERLRIATEKALKSVYANLLTWN